MGIDIRRLHFTSGESTLKEEGFCKLNPVFFESDGPHEAGGVNNPFWQKSIDYYHTDQSNIGTKTTEEGLVISRNKGESVVNFATVIPSHGEDKEGLYPTLLYTGAQMRYGQRASFVNAVTFEGYTKPSAPVKFTPPPDGTITELEAGQFANVSAVPHAMPAIPLDGHHVVNRLMIRVDMTGPNLLRFKVGGADTITSNLKV